MSNIDHSNALQAVGALRMDRARSVALPVVILVLVGALAACASSESLTPSGRSSTPGMIAADSAAGSASGNASLTILGAASLKGVLDQARTAWEAANPGSKLTISTDSSSALEAQIEQGAPADVFLSADTSNPAKLVARGLAAGDPVTFAGNELTVIVPTSNPARITTPADLAKPGLKIIAAGDGVPITAYAMKLVANLARQPTYPADLVAAYTSNVASKEDNVKAVVAKVELGEGDAAIVYVTDAKASSKVSTIAVPAGANVPATYAGVVMKGSPNPAAAGAFLDWLAGPEGKAILAGFGFRSPP
jgi:molybdate transport system substrate-binding protein